MIVAQHLSAPHAIRMVVAPVPPALLDVRHDFHRGLDGCPGAGIIRVDDMRSRTSCRLVP